jgi:cytochrome c
MKSVFVVFLMSVTCCALAFWKPAGVPIPNHNPEMPEQDNSPPKVKIESPEDQQSFAWNTQVPYTISVSDAKDGDSKYGEINAVQSMLEVTYLPLGKAGEMKDKIKKLQLKKENKGLTLMKISTCFGCHADKTRLAGPSFAELANKYQPNAATLKTLGTHILKGSTGIWGNQQMPAHPDFNLDQTMQIASYMLEEGKSKNQWIYPGLEGVLRIMEKPKTDAQGVYVLTASYTSKAKVRGQHSIVIKIK